MSEKFDLLLEIDARELLRDLDEVEKKRDQVEQETKQTISFIKKETAEAIKGTLEMARAAWLTTRGVVQAAEGTISSYFNLLIHTAFRTVEILTPALLAKGALSQGLDPTVYVALANLAVATSAAILAEVGFKDLASQLHGATTALRGLGYMLGAGYD